MDGIEIALALAALALALALRPWRALGRSGPPWPWLACCALLPLAWVADRHLGAPLVQPLSGACLLVLMMGWPLAVIALAAVALLAALSGGLGAAEALSRYVWLGLVPATLALAFGAAVRRWLPHHLFVYILGRGFFASAAAAALAGMLAALLHPLPHGLSGADLVLARALEAWGEAWLTGMLVAIFVAFRPQWLATYTDRLYLPPPPGDPPR